MTYQNILVAIDDSEMTDKVIREAAQLAKALNSQITVVSVVASDPYLNYGQGQEFLDRVRDHVKNHLTQVAEKFKAFEVSVHTQILEGAFIHHEIVTAAQNLGSELIIMGSHGRTGLTKLVLGSVAQKVLAESQIPVLVIRA